MSRVACFMSASISSASSGRASRRTGWVTDPSMTRSLVLEQPVDRGLDVDLGGVQDRQAGVGRLGQDQGELRAAEDQAVDPVAVTKPGGDRDETVTGLGEDHAMDD